MTGIQRKTNFPIAAVRAFLEITVVSIGWYLGGTVGIGTLLFAFGIGPAVALGLIYCWKEFLIKQQKQKIFHFFFFHEDLSIAFLNLQDLGVISKASSVFNILNCSAIDIFRTGVSTTFSSVP